MEKLNRGLGAKNQIDLPCTKPETIAIYKNSSKVVGIKYNGGTIQKSMHSLGNKIKRAVVKERNTD